MKLNELRDNDGARKQRMRVGRGIGSGKGKTAGRGQKGQKSREGVSIAGFEGGQMPLHMRLPKRGFNNIFAKDYAEVNIGRIQDFIDRGKLSIDGIIDHDALRAAGLARGGKDGVRILGKGDIVAPLRLKAAGVSKGAREAIVRAGGYIEIIERIVPAERAAEKHGVVRARAIAHRSQLQREADGARIAAEAAAAAGLARVREARTADASAATAATPSSPASPDLSVPQLVALRVRLAASAGPDAAAGTLSAILEAAAFVAVPQELRSMASKAVVSEKPNERALLERAVLVDLHRHLLSGNESAARAASLALARAAVRDDPRLSSLAASRDLKPAIRHEIARALAQLLFQSGDRYYSSFKLTMLEPVDDGINVAGEYALSRKLPVSPWPNETVILPTDDEQEVGPVGEYHLYSTLEGAAPVITEEKIRAADAAALFASRFSFKVPRQSLKHPFHLVFVVSNVHVETFEVKPDEVTPN